MMDVLNNPIVAYALLAAIGGILAWIGKHLKEGKLRDAVKMAASTAAGLAYAVQADAAQKGLPVPSQAAAVAEGVNYLDRRVPGALAFFGVKPEDAAQMVTGELGKLLASDPAVVIRPAPARVSQA